jgi:hypothetical protein
MMIRRIVLATTMVGTVVCGGGEAGSTGPDATGPPSVEAPTPVETPPDTLPPFELALPVSAAAFVEGAIVNPYGIPEAETARLQTQLTELADRMFS